MDKPKLIALASLSSRNGGPIDVSLPHIYKMAREGAIPVVRLGRRVLVPTWWVEKVTAENRL